jgi:hypothetical protein
MPRTGPLLARMPCMYEDTNTPFGALRTAQLQALGLDAVAAATVMPFLMPPTPMGKDAEALLLSGARILVDQGVFRAPGGLSDSLCGAIYDENDNILSKALSDATMLGQDIIDFDEREDLRAVSDFGFFFEAQARAVENGERAFSFSGRTWQSVLHLAEAHRREALVAYALARGRRAGTCDAVPSKDAHIAFAVLWRNHLAFDGKCEEMYAFRMEAEHPPKPRSALPELRWQADAPLCCGHWRMSQLVGLHQLQGEAAAQDNCLGVDHYLYQDRTSHWSLRYEPDVDADASEEAREAARERAAKLRLTVEVEATNEGHNTVMEAEARSNEQAPLESLRALEHWARTCGVVDLGEYVIAIGRGNLDEESESSEDEAV